MSEELEQIIREQIEEIGFLLGLDECLVIVRASEELVEYGIVKFPGFSLDATGENLIALLVQRAGGDD